MRDHSNLQVSSSLHAILQHRSGSNAPMYRHGCLELRPAHRARHTHNGMVRREQMLCAAEQL